MLDMVSMFSKKPQNEFGFKLITIIIIIIIQVFSQKIELKSPCSSGADWWSGIYEGNFTDY